MTAGTPILALRQAGRALRTVGMQGPRERPGRWRTRKRVRIGG